MVFSSLEFLYYYLPLCFFIYFIIPAKYLALRNAALFFVSLIFYGWSEPIYISIMLFSTVVDYICGYIVSKHRNSYPKKAKVALISSVVINLSVLTFFKYFDFIVNTISLVPFIPKIEPLGLTLPVGISFYTFQTMSYTIDIYMGNASVQKNILSFGSYVTMFPQLIAGPIVRYKDVDASLRSRIHSVERVTKGAARFICGLAKKVLLANTSGAMYERMLENNSASPSVLTSWLGIIFFAFQIYFDFSGYSDMAIGIGQILGFKFPENFNYPYISANVTEFWRRWHITLSTWFREYVYIPLGGNRKGKGRTYFNLLVVWFLTGLWHGASWNFVLWGLYFCLLLIIEKSFLLKVFSRFPKFVSHLYLLLAVLFGWFLFISCDLNEPLTYLASMFKAPLYSSVGVYDLVRSIGLILILCIASTPIPNKLYKKVADKKAIRILLCVLLPLVLLLCTAYLVDSSYNPFLYFRF